MLKLKYVFYLFIFFHINLLYGSEYVFDFKNIRLEDDGWIVGISSVMQIDSLEIINNKHPIVIKQGDHPIDLPFEFKSPLVTLFYRQIPISKTLQSNDIVHVSITSKSLNLSEAVLKFFCLDLDDNIILCDSININNNENWKRQSVDFPLNSTTRIVMGIYAIGYDLPSIEALNPQKLWLDQIRCDVNNQPINSINSSIEIQENIEIQEEINPDFATELNCPISQSLNNIYIPQYKSIIGVGEAVHGSKSINQIEIELLKNQIINKSCKLVLLEWDMYQIMTWNRFIHGQTSENYIDEIRNDLFSTLFSPEIFSDFLIWLRNYNYSTKDKVNIQGLMDYRYGWENFLFDYLYTFYNDSTASVISPILNLTMLTSLPEALIESEKSKQSLKKIMGSTEYSNYLFALEKAVLNNINNNKIPNKLNKSFHDLQNRDISMAENMDRFLDLYLKDGQSVSVIAHYGHINRKVNLTNFPYIRSMGYYLSQKYGDKYYSLAIFPGEGKIFVLSKKDTGWAEEIKLSNMLPHSLEYFCSQTNLSQFFYSTQNIKSNFLFFRSIGNKYITDEYQSGNIKEQMDGLIFINQSQAIHTNSYDFVQKGIDIMVQRMMKHAEILQTIK